MFNSNRPTLLALFAAVMFGASAAYAVEATAPTEVSLSPTRITMFKNGFGVVSGEAALPADPGRVRLTPLPRATFGGVWLGWPDDAGIEEVVARTAHVTDQRAAASIPEMLEANIGKRVRVLVDDDWLEGVLRDMPMREPSPQASARELPSRSDVLILQSEEGISVLRASRVKRVQFAGSQAGAGAQVRMMVKRPTAQPVLDFTVTAPGKDRRVAVEYMASGIAWSPSYRVAIDDDKTAVITAKAVIINDLIDLDGVGVELVTGFPHLEHAHATSGLWTDSLAEFLNALRRAPQRASSMVFNNVALQQRAYSPGAAQGGGDFAAVALAGESTEDLYFYPVDNVKLAKGERGYYPLFTAKVPYVHCYTWDIEDYVDQYNNYRNRNSEEQPEVVWHAISLKNTTSLPWTTAPGQTVKSGRVLGQDTMHYTTPGSETDLRITQALGIQAEQTEVEVDRKHNAKRIQGSHYDLVIVRGELLLTNRKKTDVSVRITKLLSGEVTQADGKPSITKVGKNLQRINPRSRVEWDVPVPAGNGKPVKVTYTYEVYIRS